MCIDDDGNSVFRGKTTICNAKFGDLGDNGDRGSKLKICGRKCHSWNRRPWFATATFNSYGDRQISTPSTKSIALNRSTKNRHSWLHPRGDILGYIPNLVEIHSLGASGENGWNITKIIFFYLYFFSLISLQVRPVDEFLRAIAQKAWNHARMCFLGL